MPTTTTVKRAAMVFIAERLIIVVSGVLRSLPMSLPLIPTLGGQDNQNRNEYSKGGFNMRALALVLTACAVAALSLPMTSSANAETKKVIIKKRGHDHGMHRGWHHRHGGKKIVIIKKRGHRHHH